MFNVFVEFRLRQEPDPSYFDVEFSNYVSAKDFFDFLLDRITELPHLRDWNVQLTDPLGNHLEDVDGVVS